MIFLNASSFFPSRCWLTRSGFLTNWSFLRVIEFYLIFWKTSSLRVNDHCSWEAAIAGLLFIHFAHSKRLMIEDEAREKEREKKSRLIYKRIAKRSVPLSGGRFFIDGNLSLFFQQWYILYFSDSVERENMAVLLSQLYPFNNNKNNYIFLWINSPRILSCH